MSSPVSACEPLAVVDVQGDRRWINVHERFLSESVEKEPDVLFIGDSIFQHLAQTEVWYKMFEPLHSLNFSIGGDQTQNLLWRICNGELNDIQPKIIVILIGTNNHEHTAEEVCEGILKIAETITEKQPQSNIIVMGIPPRGKFPNPLRNKIRQINTMLSTQVSTVPNATYLHVDEQMFVSAVNGTISHHDMYDYLHFTKTGYQKLCEPLWEEIQQLMQTYVKVESTSVDTASIAGELASDRAM
ncbi:platelet-activating factor acetylhydrolase IB subunit gamma-like [Argonauta hians]